MNLAVLAKQSAIYCTAHRGDISRKARGICSLAIAIELVHFRFGRQGEIASILVGRWWMEFLAFVNLREQT
jgi:hypothetical protein